MKRTSTLLAVVCLVVVGWFTANAQQPRTAPKPLDQTPATLCKCAGNDSSRGGAKTFEDFVASFGKPFKSIAEAGLAWKVYKAANQCDAVMIIGRLTDTGSFENKPGYCVLRTLGGWSMNVNEAFIRGGTDRNALFSLVSEIPPESMNDENVTPKQVEDDRDNHWRVIYNREIKWIEDTQKYEFENDESGPISPQNPAKLIPKLEASSGNRNRQTGERWVLDSVKVTPDPPQEGWTYSAQSTSAHMKIYNGDQASFHWTAPPQEVDSNGFTIQLTVSAQPAGQGRLAAIMGVRGYGLNTETPSEKHAAYAKAENGVMTTAQTEVVFKPTKGTTEFEVQVEFMWKFAYRYKYVRAK